MPEQLEDKNRMKILCFGEVMLRLSAPRHQLLLQSVPGELCATFGGAEANVAWGISRLGGESSFVTALPDNPMARACINQLRGIGVDVSGVIFGAGRMGTYYVEAGANQLSSKVYYDREYSLVSQTPFEAYDFDGALRGVSRVHLSGITPAISETAASACIKLAGLARSKGVAVSCDLNFRGKLWKWRTGVAARDLAREIMPDILCNTDLVIGNEEDAFDVLGIKSGESDVDSGRLDISGYKCTARKISEKFPSVKKVAFTLRESVSATHNNWGAMIYSASGDFIALAPLGGGGDYMPYKIKNIIDRVGGGDSFAAGLIYGLDSGEFACDAEALSFAVANSCLAHSVAGDYNYVSKSDVLALMRGSASGRVQR